MNARDWAVLAFRLMGVWFAASGVIGLANIAWVWSASYATYAAAGAAGVAVIMAAFPPMLSLVAGGLIWINAGALATRVFGEEPAALASEVFGDGPGEATQSRGIDAQPPFAVGLAVIGVLLLVEALPAMVEGLALFLRSRQAGTSILGPDPAQQALIWGASAQANLAAAVTRLVIGVALLAGPARLSAAYAGIRKELRSTLDDGPAQPS